MKFKNLLKMKYFVKGTDEESKFGDELQLDFTKESKHGNIFHHVECKFIPELLDILIENDIIECRDVDEEEPNEECESQDNEDIIDALVEADEEAVKRFESIEKEIRVLQAQISVLNSKLNGK